MIANDNLRLRQSLEREIERLDSKVLAIDADRRRLEATLESTGDAVIAVDTDGNIIQMNPPAEALAACRQADAIGRPLASVLRIVNGQTGGIVESPVDHVLRLGKLVGLARHTALIIRNSDERAIVDSAAPIYDAKGDVVGVAIVLRDITKEQTAQNEQWEREEGYRSLFDNMLNGFAYCKMILEDGRPSDFVYLMVNERFKMLTGLIDTAGKTASEAIPRIQELDPALFEIYGRVALTGISERFDRFVASLGMWFSVSVYSPKREYFVAIFDIITDRKAAEKAVRVSEARYRAIFENSSDGIVMSDVDTSTVRYANPAACRMFGYSDSELCSMDLTALHPRDALSRVLSKLEGVASGATHLAASIPCLKKDGTTLYADITATSVTSDGRTLSATFFRDVTEQRESRGRLEVSESRYRRLFEAARDGVLIADASSGKIVDVNAFLIELTSYSHADFLAMHLWDIGGIESVEAAKTAFAELLAHEFVRYENIPLATRDGKRVDVEVVGNIYRVNNDRVIQFNVRDITERKRNENDLRMLERAVQSASQGVLITDALRHGQPVIYASPGFERLSGYAVADAIGKTCLLLEGEDTELTSTEALRNGMRDGQDCAVEMLNYKKDGTAFWNHMAISPVRNARGLVTNFVAVQTDVTVRHELEFQLLQAQKMEAVGRLAGGVAHDFNNMLSVILSYAEMICSDLQPAEPLRADVEEIRKAALRATVLTRQLLAFSRQQVLAPKALNLHESVIEMEKMLQRLLGADIELTILSSRDLWTIQADPGQIEQVLINLAVNARDAMPRGGALTIETENAELDEQYVRKHHGLRVGAYVRLTVTDTGVGMSQDTLARVFEPFFTTKGKDKGTGLGLATVFGIVKQSGGHIWVYSEPDKGTRFKVYFPKVTDAPRARDSEAPAPDGTQGHETILLVEDDEQVRAVARAMLRARGYVVLEAPNGGEALLVCEQHAEPIDLLLTDVVLPRMSGRQLAERLRPSRPQMKVLFMSGYTDDAVLRHGVLGSGMAFIQKPITPASLLAKVREVLGGVGVSLIPPT